MERTTRTRHLQWLGAALVILALLALPLRATGAAQTDEDPPANVADDTGRVGLVELRVETSGAVTTASLVADHERFLLDLQDDLTTIVGARPSEPLVVRFTGTLPDGDGWRPLSDAAAVNADATEAVLVLDRYLALSDTDANNQLRNLVARRWLLGVSDGAMPSPLVDGFASYLETPVLARQARQASLAQQVYLDGDLPSWDALLGSEKATASLDPDARDAARLSVAAFLVERYGANMIADLAAAFADDPDGDPATIVSDVTGQPADRLTAAWDDFIAAWFAGGWRSNAFAALDLQPAKDLFSRGAYEAAVDRANATLQVATALDDTVASAEAELVVAQGSVGMQAEALMADAEAALNDHDYARALTLIDRAVDQYGLLPEDHRPASLIETWRGMATDGMAAIEQLDVATTSFNDWFSMRSSRQDAVAAGATFARLGDTERLADAQKLVDDLDDRFFMLVLALGATILVLGAWLAVWSWHRSPGRIRWPGLTEIAQREVAR